MSAPEISADFLSEMQWRGLVHQATESGLAGALAQGPLCGYAGFDPTAPSLHVGSLLPLLALVRLQRAGHRPIAIAGGGTGRIGDPSGKEAERPVLSAEALQANLAGIRRELERFLDCAGPRGALLLDNAEWLSRLNLVEFLRDVGKHFSVNTMIKTDAVRLRLEGRDQGISFTEFSYALLQAYDFLWLFDHHGCTLQLGGSDQWANIVAGCDLIRRKRSAVAHGLTFPLVTRADGRKFGKSEEGNVWLDARRTGPFEFYQFWLNADDADVVRYLGFFTFLEREAIDELARGTAAAPAQRAAQRALAREVTRLVHGATELERAERASAALFEGGDLRQLDEPTLCAAFRGAPATALARSALGREEATLAAVLAATGLVPSRSEARRTIESGGVSINHQVVRQVDRVLRAEDVLPGGFIVLRRGKKAHHVVRVTD